jgi:hypothetical protein
MKAEFENYLQDIKLSTTMLEAVEKKYIVLCTASNVEEFDEIFISEAISNQGFREYFTLWGLRKDIMCRIGIQKDELSIFRIKNHISSIEISDRNFNLTSPTETSKLQYSIRRVDAQGSIIFNASGINCAHLMTIAKAYLLSNLQI